MNKEPSQVKKSKDEILMQVCNITDKEEWFYVEHITPIQALKAMEEYRFQASSELPSDEKTLNKISNIIIRYKDEHIYIEEAEKQIIEEVISPILAYHVARIKELEEALKDSQVFIKLFREKVGDNAYFGGVSLDKALDTNWNLIKSITPPKP